MTLYECDPTIRVAGSLVVFDGSIESDSGFSIEKCDFMFLPVPLAVHGRYLRDSVQ